MKNIIIFIAFTFNAFTINAQIFDTLTVLTPGSLNSLLTHNEKITITNLKINGYIDARDFVTMRDSMPKLSVLDIENTYLAAYSGMDGSDQNKMSEYYYANEIPTSAFYPKDFYNPISSLTKIILPSSTQKIEMFAFVNCINLETVIITSALYCIDDDAFSYCRKLSITIPETVTTIGLYAFEGCAGISVSPQNPNYSSLDNVLFNKSHTLLIQCSDSKTTYTIPPTVDSIGFGSFAYCSKLTEIVFSPKIKYISDIAFSFCRSLKTIQIPNTIQYIESGVFHDCDSLLYVEIPSSIKEIKSYVFGGCLQLEKVILLSEQPLLLQSNNGIFAGVDTSKCILNVPCDSKMAYQNSPVWKSFTHINENCHFKIKPSNIIFPFSKSDTTITNMYSSQKWSAISREPWLSISPESGDSGIALIKISASENTFSNSRTASIVFKEILGTNSDTVYVTQNNAVLFLNISANYISFNSEGTNVPTIVISSNTSWNAISNQNWLNVTPTAITGDSINVIDATMTFSALVNTSSQSRTATVEITGNGVISKKIIINQLAGTGTSISEERKENLCLFPNPANTSFSINNEGMADIAIYDLTGKQVVNNTVMGSEAVSVSKLSAGLYIVKIITSNTVVTRCLLVE